MNAGRWADAAAAAHQILESDPGNAAALAIDNQAKSELKNEVEYKRFVEAAHRKQYELAVALFAKIPGDSVYQERASELHNQLLEQFLTAKTREAHDLARANKCKEIKQLATDAARVSPDVRAAVAGIACKAAVAAVANPVPTPRPNPRKADDKPVAAGGRSAAELIADAQTAAKASQWGRALNFAEQSLRGAPDESTKLTAMTIAGISACNLSNRAKAKEYYGKLKLSVSRQNWIRQRCLANDVELD
jgi:hypothetical protein